MQATSRRRSPLLLVLFAAGGVAVLGIAGWVVLSAALDPERIRAELQAAVYHATGRQLTISGPIHLAIGFAPRVVVEDIAISNIDGGSRPQMITAKSMSADMALFPLLSGDVVISGLSVQDPDVVLERASDGVPNWIFAPPAKHAQPGEMSPLSGEPSRAPPAAAASASRHRIEIRSISLEGGALTWVPLQAVPITVQIGHLLISAQSFDTPVSLRFDGSKNGVPIRLSATSGSLERLEGGPVTALAGAWPLTVDAAGAGATLHLEGGFNHPDQLRSYQFRVTAHAADLDSLNPLLPQPILPPMAEINATALLSDNSQGGLQTSQLSLHAGQSDLSRWVPGLSLKQAVLSAPGPGQLVQINADGLYQQQPMRLAATAMQPDLVGGAAPLQITLSGQAAGATISAHGTVPASVNEAGLDVSVSLHAPDLSALSPFVGRSLPPAQNVILDAQLVDAGMKLRGVAVQTLSLSSSLGDLAGSVTIDWAPRPSLSGSLTARALDLDAIAVPGAFARIAPPPSQDNAALRIPPAAPLAVAPNAGALPLALLRNNDADLTLAVGDLTFGGQHYLGLDAHVQLADGKLALNPFRAQAPEGAIVGGASIDASSDTPPIALTLRSPSISASAIARALGYPQGATGIMQVDAALTGIGQTASAIEASLDGHVGLALVNGQVQDSLIEGLIGTALDTAGLSAFGGGESQVRCFAMRVNFSDGIGSIKALALDSSRLALDGDGDVDLRNQTMDVHLRPKLRLGAADVAAPVSLEGSFGHVKAALDPVLGGNRFGLSIGGGGPVSSHCVDRLSLARNGLGGPIPAAAPAAPPGFKIRKPKDLLKGLFH